MKRLILLLPVLLLITNTVFSQLPTTSLVAWYPFCADTTDHSGNGNTLLVAPVTTPSVITTPPTLTTDRFGNPNTAYLFNGATTLMRYHTFFSAAGDFSYSCWINPSANQASTIIYNGNVNTDGYGLMMSNGTFGTAGNEVSFMFGGMGAQLSASVTLSQWHNIVFTRSGSTYQLYIDTVLTGTFVNLFYPLVSSDVFNVGLNYATGTYGFNGKIDDIAVYSAQLSLTQIKALYHFNPDVTPFTLGNDTAICTNSVVLSASAATPAGQYTWGTGTTTIATTTTVTVTPPVFPGTNYWLTITVPYGCTSSDTVNVREVVPHVRIGPRDTTFCAGNTVLLNTPVRGETYMWSTGDTTGRISVNTAGTYWLTVDSSGCFGSDTMTINLKVQPLVNLGPDTASCSGNPVTLQSSVPYVTPTYLWGGLPSLGPGVTTATFTPSVTGTYWLTVTDTSGCPGADTINVLIVYDTFTFPQVDTAICMGASFPTGVTINPNIIYQWTPTTGIATSNVADPTIVTTVSATYVLTATYVPPLTYHGVNCPVIIDSFHLDVQPNPVIAFLGPPRSVCKNDTLHITASVSPSSYTHYLYSWSPGISLADSTSSTVVFTAGDSTSLVLTVSTPHGCFAKDSIQINVHQIGFDSLIAPIDTLCPGDSAKLVVYLRQGTYYQGLTATYQWTPTIYLTNPTSDSTWVHPITSQDYMVVGTSQFGCQDTAYTTVHVHPAGVIYLPDSVTIYPGQSYQISPQTNCLTFSWTPELGLNDTLFSNPVATPLVSTNYIVHGVTEWGCVAIDSIRIHVEQNTIIALPNVFTPGASVNNTLKILNTGLASLNYFRIYDRWGNLVYSSTNLDDGWDGTYKGKAQPFDVYVYEVEAVSNTGFIVQKQGNVTLLR